MGLCNSTFCTKAQVEEIFRLATVEMLLLCAEAAVRQGKQIAICGPMETQQLVDDLKSNPKAKLSIEAQSRNAYDGLVKMFLLGRPREAGAGVGYHAALATAVRNLESSLQALNKPMTNVAREVLAKNQDEVLKAYKDAIAATHITSNVELVRKGADNAISRFFTAVASQRICAALEPMIVPILTESQVSKAWQACVERVAEVNAKLNSMDSLKHLQMAPLPPDATPHIAEEMVRQLGDLMGKEEKGLRDSPEGKSRRPQTFRMCFSYDPPLHDGLPRSWYDNRDK